MTAQIMLLIIAGYFVAGLFTLFLACVLTAAQYAEWGRVEGYEALVVIVGWPIVLPFLLICVIMELGKKIGMKIYYWRIDR